MMIIHESLKYLVIKKNQSRLVTEFLTELFLNSYFDFCQAE